MKKEKIIISEEDIHIALSSVKIDDDNLDYIKQIGEICGNLRWDIVKALSTYQSKEN